MGWSTTAVAGTWITCIAALFLAVGFSIPFWISFLNEVATTATDTKTYNVYIGVWYVMSCIKGEADSCKTGAIEPDFSNAVDDSTLITGTNQAELVASSQAQLEHARWWWVVQIVTTVGLGFVLLATLILICCRCAGIHSKGFFVISGVLLFFGGLLSLVISILVAIGIAEFFKFVSNVKIKAETFPWSVLCFGLGGLLALVGALIIMYVVFKWKRLGDYIESDEDSRDMQEQPMSNLSKSYDRPRKHEGSRYDYNYDRRYENDFSRSKKYRDSDRDYPRDYPREYSRDNYRDYDRSNPAYDYNSYDRAYSKGYTSNYDYDYDRAKAYSHSRPADNMYRPYDQYRY